MARKRKSYIGYIIKAQDTSWYMKREWVILKGTKSVPLDSTISYKDCYTQAAYAKSTITRLTYGTFDTTTCVYEVVPIKFDSIETSIKVMDALNEKRKDHAY